MNRLILVVLVASTVLIGACGYQPSQQIQRDIQPPSPPNDLLGEPVSQNIINLRWSDNSNNEDGFKIYRNDVIIASIGPNSRIYQDTGLEAGQTYRYTVRAYNEAGESGASYCAAKTLNPPLNVTIDYVGVMFDHDPIGPGDIKLVCYVSDGSPANDVKEIMPPGEGSYSLSDYQVTKLNHRIFHTSAAGEYLKIVIIAYEDDPERLLSDAIQTALSLLGPIFGIPYASEIGAVFSEYEEQTGSPLFENKDDYVGYFQGFWGSDESWGIGQHNAVGTDDFKIWLSIWSDSQPEPVTNPILAFSVNFDGWYIGGNRVDTALKADTVIARLSLSGGNPGQYKMQIRRDIRWAPDQTVVEDSFYYDGRATTRELSFIPPYATNENSTDGYHIDLLREGSSVWSMTDAYPPRLRVEIPLVRYQLSSSVSPSGGGSVDPASGIYDSGAAVRITATPATGYQFSHWSGDSSGTSDTITITMNSDKHVVANFRVISRPLSVKFDGWYVGSSRIDTAVKGDTVTASFSLSGGNSGQYKMQIRRDIRWAPDQTVVEDSFYYDGSAGSIELSFVPPYATNENSTDGYHIDLLREGSSVWSMTDAYPPRLRVTLP